MTPAVTAVSNMSVYNTLDKGIASEIRADDVSPRRRALNAAASAASADALNDAHYARRALPANEPFTATFDWLASLPCDVRPLALLQRFPRIANRLANAWNDPADFREYMFDLLIDRRSGRKGFPLDVESELLALRTFFDDVQPLTGVRSRERLA